MKGAWKIVSIEEEGTANDGLLVTLKRGKERWSGYLEKLEDED